MTAKSTREEIKQRKGAPCNIYKELVCEAPEEANRHLVMAPRNLKQSLNAKAARIGIISIAKKYLRMLSLTSAANGAVPIVCRLNVFTLPLMKIHLLPYNSFNIQSSNKQLKLNYIPLFVLRAMMTQLQH